MDNMKTQTAPIIDIECIDYQLKQQGLSQKNGDKLRDGEPLRLLQQYATQHASTLFSVVTTHN
eukprot:2097400-Amphidinium_carterae.1